MDPSSPELKLPIEHQQSSSEVSGDQNVDQFVENQRKPELEKVSSDVNLQGSSSQQINTNDAALLAQQHAQNSSLATNISIADTTISTNSNEIAANVDLIEKIWVTKAKDIIEKTKNNPYDQKNQLSTFKAEYVLERYKKQLKKSDDIVKP